MPSCDELAALWLQAEERVRSEPENERFEAEAERLGEAYAKAIAEASQEELRLAWEAAQRAVSAELIGTREWGDARRIAELLRTEYRAARPEESDLIG